MGLNLSTHSSPLHRKHLKAQMEHLGLSPMQQFRKKAAASGSQGPKVTCKGFSDLDEALAVKKILEEKGIGDNVRFENNDLECEIRGRGFEPITFSFIAPEGLPAQEIREMVTKACIADDQEFDKLEEIIRLDDRYLLIRDKMLENINIVRQKLNPKESNEEKSPIEEFEEMLNSFVSVYYYMNGQDKPQVSSQPNQEITMEQTTNTTASPATETTNMTNETNMDTNAQNTTTQAADSTTQASVEQPTVKVETAAEAQTKNPGAISAFVGAHKKKLMIGAGVVAAGALAYVGFRNFDKISTIFGKTGEAAQ